MPYPAAREHPDSTPCVKEFRGSKLGVREAAKNSVPRRTQNERPADCVGIESFVGDKTIRCQLGQVNASPLCYSTRFSNRSDVPTQGGS
jgi:hypothetical protein